MELVLDAVETEIKRRDNYFDVEIFIQDFIPRQGRMVGEIHSGESKLWFVWDLVREVPFVNIIDTALDRNNNEQAREFASLVLHKYCQDLINGRQSLDSIAARLLAKDEISLPRQNGTGIKPAVSITNEDSADKLVIMWNEIVEEHLREDEDGSYDNDEEN